VTIHSANPCATWARLTRAWEEANKKMWLYGYWLEAPTGRANPYRFRAIEDAGSLVVYEHPGASFQEGGRVWGAYFRAYPTEIHFAAGYTVDGELWDPLPHEVGHWLWWLERDRYGARYVELGHGTPDDPYYQLYKAFGNILYCPHPSVYGCRTVAETEEGPPWVQAAPYETQRSVEIEAGGAAIFEGAP